ncbi:MAG TPA: hypothetical protein VFJ85_08490 [Acidimicrobiales bacterium]|nr:hypothetical protein [Acidimicrobiales bacterium]
MNRRRALLAGLAALAVVAAVVALRPAAARPARRPAARHASIRVVPVPARTEDGAVAAAVTIATASQDWLYLDDDAMAAAVRGVATTEAADGLVAKTVGDLGRARDALAASPGRVWWVVRPLATHLEAFTPVRARVVVWTVGVLSAAEVALPQADFSRVAVSLEWQDGAWRCAAMDETPGPTPGTGAKDGPWQAVAFDQALAGFERVGAGR